jgi:Tfp pilus assembly protein PilN
MFKINLLPKEVLERRRYEDWYPRIFAVAVVLLVIVAGLYVLLMFDVNSKRNDLQSIQEQTKRYSTTAEELSIFRNKEQQLQQRETIAQSALAGRANVGQVANDISLVLPDEVWLDNLVINEKTGVVVTANTPRTSGESNDVAYKSVAKTLVRLSELSELSDVWLTSANNAVWNTWATAPASTDTSGAPQSVNVVSFIASGKVVVPGGSSPSATGSGSSASGSAGGSSPGASAQNAATQANSSTTRVSQ